MGNIISLRNIAVAFEGEDVLKGINLDIGDKEFVTLLGPSGCGKTTTLRIIGGFVEPDEGTVLFEGKNINNLPPYKRNINTVFQKYALFPHLNVYDNIAFGLRVKKIKENAVKEAVTAILKLVNLEGFEKRAIHKLSGGQQQRVAIARGLAVDPDIIFMDEPFGALDAITRMKLQEDILRISREEKKTIIFVTHDIEEAVFLADRIVVMMANPGRIKSVVKVPLGSHRDRTAEDFFYVRDKIFELFNMKADSYIEYYI